MANEKLTIQQNDARLTVIGRSYPDELTDSGDGLDLPDIIIDELEDLDIDLPDIPDDVDIIIGLDDDGIPEIIWVDPDTGDIEEWPLDDLDWDDFLDDFPYDDLLLDIDICTIDSLISIDNDFNINMDDLPTSIEVIFPPNKTEYLSGQVISKDGLYVYAYKADGSIWRGSERIGDKYVSGRVPNDELILDPKVASYDDCDVQNGHISDTDLYVGGLRAGGPFNFSMRNGTVQDYFTPDFWHELGTTPIASVSRDGVPGDWGIFSNGYPYRVTHLGGGVFLAARLSGGPCAEKATNIGVSSWSSTGGGDPFTYQGKTVYYQYFNYYQEWFSGSFIGESVIDHPGAAAWAMWYGGGIQYDGDRTVTVSWPRPGDGMILTTSFEITVKPGGGGR